MRDWLDLGLLGLAVVLAASGFLPRLRLYRALIWGGAVLATITALHPRPGNTLALFLYGVTPEKLPGEFFGVVWWILGAWLVRSSLDIVLKRTLFPNDDQPHSRRLFADLIFIVVYVVALIGIMDTVFQESISTVLATSGVVAVILGLALQSTLGDVLSGLALNVDRPFRSGDWITLADNVEGQVIQINWRATRLKTLANTMINIPNSVIAKAIVTSHRPLTDPYYCTIEVRVDHSVAPSRVIDALKQAACSIEGTASGADPAAFASAFADTIIVYQLSFAVADFSRVSTVRSDVITRVTQTLAEMGIPIGAPVMDVHIVRNAAAPVSRGESAPNTPQLMIPVQAKSAAI
jgi:small-conductance mechanosensitive channel